MVPTWHYLALAAALFTVGVIGVLTRRNIIIIFMSLELILNAVNINLIAFARHWGLRGWPHICYLHHHRSGRRSGCRLGNPDRFLPQPRYRQCGRNRLAEMVRR